MNGQLVESRKWSDEQERDVLDVLSQSDAPAVATDVTGHVVFWNQAAERLSAAAEGEVMGRRCYDIEAAATFRKSLLPRELSVVSMGRKGERCRPSNGARPPRRSGAAGCTSPSSRCRATRPEPTPSSISCSQSTARPPRERALERLGADRTKPRVAGIRASPPPSGSTPRARAAPDGAREGDPGLGRPGLPEQGDRAELGISLATVRNHVHNILEKLEVHSKLEAVSLAFRQGWVSPPRRRPGPAARVAAPPSR